MTEWSSKAQFSECVALQHALYQYSERKNASYRKFKKKTFSFDENWYGTETYAVRLTHSISRVIIDELGFD